MDSNELDKEDSSNDDFNDYKADEKTSLKKRKHSDYSGSSYKKKKKYKNSNSILNIILQSIIIILIIVLFFFVFIKAIKRVNIKSIKDNYNLRNNKNNIKNNTVSELKLNNSTISSTIIKDKKPSNEIIDDIKNIEIYQFQWV